MKTKSELVGYIMVVISPKIIGEAKANRILCDNLQEKDKVIILN